MNHTSSFFSLSQAVRDLVNQSGERVANVFKKLLKSIAEKEKFHQQRIMGQGETEKAATTHAVSD